MFLLNIDGSVNINFGHRRFKIQNVPIKLNTISYNASQSKNLQYKMFLLNQSRNMARWNYSDIYNTKCSY